MEKAEGIPFLHPLTSRDHQPFLFFHILSTHSNHEVPSIEERKCLRHVAPKYSNHEIPRIEKSEAGRGAGNRNRAERAFFPLSGFMLCWRLHGYGQARSTAFRGSASRCGIDSALSQRIRTGSSTTPKLVSGDKRLRRTLDGYPKAPYTTTVLFTQQGGRSKAVSRHKAVKIAWRDWGIARITWTEQGGLPGHIALAHPRLFGRSLLYLAQRVKKTKGSS